MTYVIKSCMGLFKVQNKSVGFLTDNNWLNTKYMKTQMFSIKEIWKKRFFSLLFGEWGARKYNWFREKILTGEMLNIVIFKLILGIGI